MKILRDKKKDELLKNIQTLAKAYDKAIEKIKYVMEHGVSPTLNKEDLQDIFPELRESEDERIANAIRRHLDTEKSERNLTGYFGVTYDEAVSWLEKQGNKPQVDGFDAELNTLLKKYEHLPKEELAECLSFYIGVIQDIQRAKIIIQ